MCQTHWMDIHEAWMFEDDSVLVKFDNGCRLQLSSCGAVFRCFSPTDKVNGRNEHLNKETQQCSQFATTTWKGMVKQAVDFRNKFACYPYLCPNLSETVTTAERHKVVNSTSCTWSAEDPEKNINQSHDGSISITSKEKNATVILSACKQSFSVNFLCKIQTEKLSESKRPAYSWVRQIHSTNLLHAHCFYHPVNLLNAGTMVEKNAKQTSNYTVCELPQSLPQQCKKHHLHRWRSHWNVEECGACEFLDRELIKVYYSENVFYRFYYEKYLIGEVTFPDGSVLRSTGSTHLYFKHWVYDSNSESVHENLYSARAPPLNDRTSLIAKVLNTVCRYLKCLNVYWKRQMSLDCCWKNYGDSETVDEKIELKFSTYLRDHGSFKTFSNGKVRIAFCDGAIIEFYEPNEGESKLPNKDVEHYYGRSNGKQSTDLVVDTSFNLILPNGISLKASFDNPSRPYIRYVKVALDFIKWKKNHVGKELQLDDENSNLVHEELEKLRRFTDTATVAFNKNNKEDIVHSVDTHHNSAGLKTGTKNVSNTSPSKARVIMPPLSEIRNMEEYLNSTRKTVDEIDLILQNCKSHLKKR